MFKWKFNRYAIILFVIIVSVVTVNSRDFSYEEVNLKHISRFNENRIVYQQIEHIVDPEVFQHQDPSVATLLIIKDQKVLLFKDGYDDPKVAEENYLAKSRSNRLSFNETWERDIDGKPDYLVVAERKREVLKNIILPGSNGELKKEYVDFYIKTREAFLQAHVDKFRQIVSSKTAEDLNLRGSVSESSSDSKGERVMIDAVYNIHRIAIPKKLSDDGPTKYKISVTAKTKEGAVYYAEDADGDGVTETFTLDINDGFAWGYKSGPNIIFIFKNKQEDIKNIIGNLCKEAYEGGSPEEIKLIDQRLNILEKEVPILMDQIIKGNFDGEQHK